MKFIVDQFKTISDEPDRYVLEFQDLLSHYLGQILPVPMIIEKNEHMSEVDFVLIDEEENLSEEEISKIKVFAETNVHYPLLLKKNEYSVHFNESLQNALTDLTELSDPNSEQALSILKNFESDWLKPDNILIIDGYPVLKCWGIKSKYLTHLKTGTIGTGNRKSFLSKFPKISKYLNTIVISGIAICSIVIAIILLPPPPPPPPPPPSPSPSPPPPIESETASLEEIEAYYNNSEFVTHTIRNGESLWTIAKKYNISVHDLAAVNKLRNGTRIRIGQKLIIPVLGMDFSSIPNTIKHTKPEPLVPIRAAYPPLARKAGVEGTVVVLASVNRYGFVDNAHIHEGIPYYGFNEAAVNAVRSARFKPAKAGSKSVKADVKIPVTFKLLR